jgi:hypothetical protein
VYASKTSNAYSLHLIFLAPCRPSSPQVPLPRRLPRQSGAVRAAQCPAARGNDQILGPRDMHVDTVDIGLWRLHVQRRLRRCAARAVRLLPHARWHKREHGRWQSCPIKQGYHFGADRRFHRHGEHGVSTMICVCVRVCLFHLF